MTQKPKLWDATPTDKKDFFGNPLYEPVWVTRTNDFLMKVLKVIGGIIALAILVPITLFFGYLTLMILVNLVRYLMG